MNEHNPEQTPKTQKNPLDQAQRVEYTAMLIISVTTLQTCISINPPDHNVLYSIACFTLAIPMLTSSLYEQFRKRPPLKRTAIIGGAGSICAFIGLLFIITHVFPPAALLLLLSCVTSIMFFHIKIKKKR